VRVGERGKMIIYCGRMGRCVKRTCIEHSPSPKPNPTPEPSPSPLSLERTNVEIDERG
jgi:hypothetical protein